MKLIETNVYYLFLKEKPRYLKPHLGIYFFLHFVSLFSRRKTGQNGSKNPLRTRQYQKQTIIKNICTKHTFLCTWLEKKKLHFSFHSASYATKGTTTAWLNFEKHIKRTVWLLLPIKKFDMKRMTSDHHQWSAWLF